MARAVAVAVPDLTELAELLRRCASSREARRHQCEGLRRWYEQGTDTGIDARYNKLVAHIDRLMSFLWAPEDVRFSIHLPKSVRQGWLDQAAVARDEFRETWDNAKATEVFDLALEWALVYSSTVVKVQADPFTGITYGYIDPWDFGVSREDQALSEQDLMAHWYTLSIPQFARWAAGHPRETELMRIAGKHAATPPSGGSGRLPRLIVTGITGVFPAATLSGAFPGDPSDQADRVDPNIIEPIIPMVDLWERIRYRDAKRGVEFEDWRVTTMAGEAEDFIEKRRNPIVPWLKTGTGIEYPAEQPFALITPRPLPNYIWGRSELARLLKLQLWREDHVTALKAGVGRQLNPPKFFSGINDADEAGRALESEGGSFGSSDPSAKMEPVPPQIPQDAYTFTDRIDAMFADASGIPPQLEGQAQPNVRNTGQMFGLAGIGAGRVRRMALKVEDAVARLATVGFMILQREDAQVYLGPDGAGFLLAQLPPGTRLGVSSHSSSPIFSEQTQAKAVILQKAGAIDGETMVELLNPPFREELKAKARELAKSSAQRQQQMLEIQRARFLRGPRKA